MDLYHKLLRIHRRHSSLFILLLVFTLFSFYLWRGRNKWRNLTLFFVIIAFLQLLYILYLILKLIKNYFSVDSVEGFCNDNDPSIEYFIMRYDIPDDQVSNIDTYNFDEFNALLTRMNANMNNLGINSILKWYKQDQSLNQDNKPIYYLYENNDLLTGVITHQLYYDRIDWKIKIYGRPPGSDPWQRYEGPPSTLSTEYLLENKDNRMTNSDIMSLRVSGTGNFFDYPSSNGRWIIRDFDRGSKISFNIIIDTNCSKACVQEGVGTPLFDTLNNIGTRKLYDDVREKCGGDIVNTWSQTRVELPDSCSQECSDIFIPWFDGCDENKEFSNTPGKLSELQDFYNLCNT